MTSEESEPLSSLAVSLLALEKNREGPSAAEEQRVLDRLVQVHAFQPVATAASGGGLKGVLAKVAVGAAVGAVVGGAVVGAWFSGQLEDARADLAAAKASVPPLVAPEPAPLAPVPQLEAPIAPAPAPSRHAKVKALTVAGPQVDSLSEEAALIDQARTALLKNNLEGAGEALAQHQAKFPSGRMVEEREVMGIQVLLGLGKEAEARAAGERFRRLHPSSLLAPTVEAIFERAP